MCQALERGGPTGQDRIKEGPGKPDCRDPPIIVAFPFLLVLPLLLPARPSFLSAKPPFFHTFHRVTTTMEAGLGHEKDNDRIEVRLRKVQSSATRDKGRTSFVSYDVMRRRRRRRRWKDSFDDDRSWPRRMSSLLTDCARFATTARAPFARRVSCLETYIYPSSSIAFPLSDHSSNFLFHDAKDFLSPSLHSNVN